VDGLALALLVLVIGAVPVLLLGGAIFAFAAAADLRTTNGQRAVRALLLGLTCLVLFAGIAFLVGSIHFV
jgi:hypothetical protein